MYFAAENRVKKAGFSMFLQEEPFEQERGERLKQLTETDNGTKKSHIG